MKSFVVFLMLIAIAACTKQQERTALNSTDIEFMQQISYANYAAIKAASIADTNASDEAVKTFANNVFATQTAAQNSLSTLAASLNIEVPLDADSAHQRQLSHLAALKGHLFDEAYINAQVTGYVSTIYLYNKELSDGSNTQVISFARSHLSEIVYQSDDALYVQELIE